MGWVAEKFKEHEDTKNHLDGLWNGLRDSCQIAVSEFVVKIDQLNVERRDCSARGKRCQRITKGTQFIEIFISESDQSVRSALGTDKEIVLAYYRLKDGGKGLEFFEERDGGSVSITADVVCRKALEEFLFNPPPFGYLIGLTSQTSA